MLIGEILNRGVLPRRSFEWECLVTNVKCVFHCFYNVSGKADPTKRNNNKKDRSLYESEDSPSLDRKRVDEEVRG